ncbi:MAG: histone deacetylase family protein [Pseudomonadota bacterium]
MLLYSDPIFLEHETPAGHAESPDRLRAIERAIGASSLNAKLVRRTPPPVPEAAILAAHSAEHVARLRALAPEQEIVPIDPDTSLSPRSLPAAEHAAGALVDATTRVLDGDSRRAFCAVRPPGHHAERGDAMGFCLLNSVAVAALAALERSEVERVAILDFDVHHGNGTVDVFRNDPRVLVCSSFQFPFYPHRLHDVPGDHLIHTPLPAGTGSSSFRLAIERDWLPALKQHRPDLILLSAGFDAHAADPLAQLELEVEDYRWITELIVDQAEEYAHGRIVSTLEGGYHLEALAASVLEHLETLSEGESQ